MPNSLSLIGIDPVELRWLRLLIGLLRHPDPNVPELARQALLYIADTSENGGPAPHPDSRFRGSAS
jgi:hypothetical protein